MNVVQSRFQQLIFISCTVLNDIVLVIYCSFSCQLLSDLWVLGGVCVYVCARTEDDSVQIYSLLLCLLSALIYKPPFTQRWCSKLSADRYVFHLAQTIRREVVNS